MAWIILCLAGLMEVAGVVTLNEYNRRRRSYLIFFMAAFMILSVSLLGVALRTIPMGTGYAIWTGIGAAGGTIVGMLFYHESRDWKRILFISLIIIGAVGLKFTTGA
ncbi:QacE family quaternary ammonium compound efflux SMR transporter [Weissella viridescens]|uniref:QacE family quaternary ammonium compound efflux SMR transporter n=1 Tax=Weissella viridescens TaxID=1629 RepID=A0A3P2REC0_WEIVI|nr:multidrug efflux SMR transporter [Weissella viridescens]RRG17755.1 QacE family quaternary ammonium compound efflux SMR transporter [Weissella viridescens]